MDKYIYKIKNGDNNINMKFIIEALLVFVLLPGLMKGMFYVGRLTGEAIAGWF